MQLHSFAYDTRTGWSVPRLPDLDSAQTLVVVFGSTALLRRPEPLQGLLAAYPRSCVIGCSTAGEIHGDVLRDDSLSVAVMRLLYTPLRQAVAEVRSAEGSFAAGQELARRLVAPDLRGVFVVSDGLCVNGTQLVLGLTCGLPEGVVITGGLAGDGDRFKDTCVVAGGPSRSGIVAAVGFYGDRVRIGSGSYGGWDIFGPERVVTRSQGNVLYELDGHPALQLYKTYLGERAVGLPAAALLFPLALRAGPQNDRRVVRTVLSIDEQAQSMTFAGDVPEEWLAQLMRANFERLIEGAGVAARHGIEGQVPGQPLLALAISCVGRRLVLGQRTEEEIEATREMLPPGSHLVGFYSYGEICPYTTGTASTERRVACAGPSDLHNQTMTLTTLSES